jgi:hypothetical protein
LHARGSLCFSELRDWRTQPFMSTHFRPVSDDELRRRAESGGPASAEARVLEGLRLARAKDRQIFAFRVGDYYLTGPMPDAKTEAVMLGAAEIIEHCRRLARARVM